MIDSAVTAPEAVVEAIRKLASYQRVILELGAGRRVEALQLPRAGRLPFSAALYHDLACPIVILTDRADHALSLWEEMCVWLPVQPLLMAEPNPLFYERSAWSLTVRHARLQALTALASGRLPLASRGGIPLVIASGRAMMARTMPPDAFVGATYSYSQGNVVRPDLVRRRLVAAGYAHSNIVSERGQFAGRGGILDIWPPADVGPVRLEFAGDSIEAIRAFDPASQRTLRIEDQVVTTPAREFIRPADEAQANDPAQDESEFDIPLLHTVSACMLDYVDRAALILIDDRASLDTMMAEVEEQAVQLRTAAVADGALPREFPLPYVTWSEIQDQLQSRHVLDLGYPMEAGEPSDGYVSDLGSEFRHDRRFGGQLKPFVDYLKTLQFEGETIVVVSRQRARLQELWGSSGAASDPDARPGAMTAPEFAEATLREGFVIGRAHLITDSEIFGWERPASRPAQHLAVETPESIYADLRPGDLVVHVDHGIGRYLGLAQRDLDGYQREYLALEYESGGQLYVPVHQADRLTRYVGTEGAQPALDRLGGQEWHQKRGRAKEAVVKVAQEMLELNAQRHIALGHAFGPDTTWQAELEESFPYVETEDQIRAMSEIKRDMENPRPMDRLLCGDVGYGKTELALRSAFKAVMDGKQVGVLVPTTVLAQQHYETFQERLAAYPVKVEMLSRFRSPKEQSQIVGAISRGEIDIVIGTHRLLSEDVRFKDLGLVIIDEEQRFGVSHKEHLKQLRTEVDVLTLTATPIPRTLYMALTGVRDISNLNTPPEERLSVITHVGPYSPKLTRQAILRELERGGQIFFVHNRVNTIEAMRAHLSQLVPEAHVDVGHGQMPEHELADVMHRFNSGVTDLLLSTTIIESGLDIPNANTLIVDRADTFGLAQLYQLRGRVGRGAARAYAYFFRHRKISPTPDAQQRLEVIAENTELGSGYSIAMRDLEIRGAGELLGTQQHGHIQAVGFHLYTRLLADAVRHLRAGASRLSETTHKSPESRLLDVSGPISLPVTVDLPLPAGIPVDYITDTDLRLRLYRRIADLRDEAEVEAVSSEFADRFGPLPQAVMHLLYQLRVKLAAEQAGLSSVTWEGGQIVLRSAAAGNRTDAPRYRDLGPDIRGGKGAYWCSFGKDADWTARLLQVLHQLKEQEHDGTGLPREARPK